MILNVFCNTRQILTFTDHTNDFKKELELKWTSVVGLAKILKVNLVDIQ